MGNAWARLACMQPAKVIDGARFNLKESNVEMLKQAERCLEKAVDCSWKALIKESILHETAEDETSIVSECTLDLAHACLKLSECDEGRSEEMRSKARSALMQAVYIKPLDVNLYYLLARVGEPEEGSIFIRRIYEQIKLIKPDSPRIKANLVSIESENGREPASWLTECKECCDEEAYERVYHFLASAIMEKDGTRARKLCFDREKLCADLSKVAAKKKRVITVLEKMEVDCSREKRPRACLALIRLAQYLAICSDCKASLEKPLERISELVKQLGLCDLLHNNDIHSNIFINKDYKCILKHTEYLSVLGSIFLELAKIKEEEYVDGGKNEAAIELNLIDICNNEMNAREQETLKEGNSADYYNNLSSKEYSEIFLRCSVRCMLRMKHILDGGFKDVESINFYKKEICYYRVETGKTLLDLGEISLFLETDHRKCDKLAKKLFEEALETLKDDDQEIKRNKIRMHLARAYLACGKLPNALKEAQLAKDLNPLDYEERKVLGEIFCKLEEYKYGLSELNTALSYKPDDPEILLFTGRAYFSELGKTARERAKNGPGY